MATVELMDSDSFLLFAATGLYEFVRRPMMNLAVSFI